MHFKFLHIVKFCSENIVPVCALMTIQGFPGDSVVKKKKQNPPANTGGARDVGSVPGLGRSPGGGYGNLFQYSCLGNPMDRGAWPVIALGVAKSRTRLSEHEHEQYRRVFTSLCLQR